MNMIKKASFLSMSLLALSLTVSNSITSVASYNLNIDANAATSSSLPKCSDSQGKGCKKGAADINCKAPDGSTCELFCSPGVTGAFQWHRACLSDFPPSGFISGFVPAVPR